MPRRLTPRNAIRTFEASARHGGLVAAAHKTRPMIVISSINLLVHRWLALHLDRLSRSVSGRWIEFRAEPDPEDFEDRGAIFA